MSVFSDKFTKIIAKYNVTAKELCRSLGIKESYFSKLKSGAIVPQSYSYLEPIFREIGLSEEDADELREMYEITKFGSSYTNIIRTIRNVYFSHSELPELLTGSVPQNHVITGRNAVISAVSAIFGTPQHELRIVLQNSEVMREISGVLGHEGCVNKWILYLCEPAAENAVEHNFSVFSELCVFFARYCANVRAEYCQPQTLMEHTDFPFEIIGDDKAVIIDRKCENAVIEDDPETVSLLKKKYDEKYDSLECFCASYDSIMDFLTKSDEVLKYSETEQNTVYVIRKTPCLLWGATDEIIARQLKPTPYREVIAQTYRRWIYKYTHYTNHEVVIFTENGLRDVFSDKEHYEFSPNFTLPVSKKTRMECAGRLSEVLRAKSFVELRMLKKSVIDDIDCMMINLWTNGNLLFVIDVGDKTRILAAHDSAMVQTALKLIDDAVDEGLVSSAVESESAFVEAYRNYCDK